VRRSIAPCDIVFGCCSTVAGRALLSKIVWPNVSAVRSSDSDERSSAIGE
jgi:hypothetical protein